MCNTPQSVVRPAGSASGTSCACGGRVRVVAALTSNNGTLCACGEAKSFPRIFSRMMRDAVRVRGGRDDGRR